MEDQPTDSGFLTDSEVDASVPLGKSARSRHRLPRQKARQTGEAGEAGDGMLDVPEAGPIDEVPETAVAAAAKDETADLETAHVETADLEPAEEEPADVETAEGQPAKDVAAQVESPIAAAEAADDADVTEDALHDPEPEPVLVAHRPAGRVLKVLAVAAGVLFVAAGAFAGAMLQPYLADRAAVQTKFQIAETAASAITTLWTYTPDDMDKLPERSARFLGGDFATDYQRYIDAIAAPNKQAQVSNNTEVLGAAVESLTPTEATAIVYTNSVATSPVTKGIPSLRYLSYRLTMKRDADRWLITQMVAVTKLDLTPRL